MTVPDRFSGDPRLILTPRGADLDFEGGQPVMDQGIENQAMISLFTAPGWCGNALLPDAEQVGSDFESVCGGALTLTAITADIPNAAARALKSDLFPSAVVVVTNPQSYRVRVVVTLGQGAALTLDRRGMLWAAESSNPASARIAARKGVGL